MAFFSLEMSKEQLVTRLLESAIMSVPGVDSVTSSSADSISTIQIMYVENTDVDIEVHGVTPLQLAEILDGMGGRLEMGASFGIYGLKGYGLDIAMPRRERATGRAARPASSQLHPSSTARAATPTIRHIFTTARRVASSWAASVKAMRVYRGLSARR